jgi:hypothetical protein
MDLKPPKDSKDLIFHVHGCKGNYTSTIIFVNDICTNTRIWDPLVRSIENRQEKFRLIRFSEYI